MKLLRLATAVGVAVMSNGVSAKTVAIPGMLYAQSLSFDAAAPTLLSYKEFNPSLGTLDSVEITFTGQALIRSATQADPTGVSSAPYTAPINLNLGFDSISRDFETTLDSIAPLTVAAEARSSGPDQPMPRI